MDISDEYSACAGPPPTLRVDRRSLVVLAGLPGAGKSTVLGKLRAGEDAVALDSEQVRTVLRALLPASVPYRWYRPLVHAAHRARIAWNCLVAPGPVIAHEPSTRATTRAMLVAFAWCTGRQRVLVWLHVDPREALAGQHARGRLIRRRSFRRHVQRALRMHLALQAGKNPAGWREVHVFTRQDVLDGLRVEPRG